MFVKCACNPKFLVMVASFPGLTHFSVLQAMESWVGWGGGGEEQDMHVITVFQQYQTTVIEGKKKLIF